MININRNNYEIYLVDYLDGKLSGPDKDTLLLFLDKNPDIKEELEVFEEEALVAGKVVYPEKESLKKESLLASSKDNFQEMCIAAIEGGLSPSVMAEFKGLLEGNNARQKEYELYKLTRLEADTKISFPNKGLLKQKQRNSWLRQGTYTFIPVAASILIVMGVYLFMPKNTDVKKAQSIAENIETAQKTEKNGNINDEKGKLFIEKAEPINSSKIIANNNITKVILDTNTVRLRQSNFINSQENIQVARLSPLDINYSYNKAIHSPQLVLAGPIEIEKTDTEKQEEYHSFKSFLAATFNKKVLNKENKDRIELFDIAQAGIEGLNKLTGSNMKLERKLDKDGNPDMTEFNSRLIAFSAPIKKD